MNADEWCDDIDRQKAAAAVRERLAVAEARLAEEIENAATYKQERDEIVVNYETVAAQLTEAHRQNADLMAIIDKRDEALGFIPLDKGMDMMDELREAKARLAEAERDAARYRFIKQWARRLDITGYSLTNNEHFEPRIDEAMQLRPADSAEGGHADPA